MWLEYCRCLSGLHFLSSNDDNIELDIDNKSESYNHYHNVILVIYVSKDHFEIKGSFFREGCSWA